MALDIMHGMRHNAKMKSYKTIWINEEKKQVRLHRYLMEKHIGRRLLPSELVHHINEDIHDNRIENLEILTRAEHKKRHPEIGRETRFAKKVNLDKKELQELRNKGLSTYKIALIFNCSQPTIHRGLKNYGIK